MKSSWVFTPRCSSESAGSCSAASMQAAAGSSSQPISNSSRGRICLLLLLEVELSDRANEVAYAADVRGPLGDRDRAARVEQVERVRST